MNLSFCKLRYFSHRLFGNLSSDAVPVITIPSYLNKQIKKLRAKQEHERLENVRGKTRMGNRNIPVITCPQKKELNHFLGRTYERRRELPLITLGWKKSKYIGHSFTIHKHADNPYMLDPGEASFSSLGLDSHIVRILEKQGLKTPSVIQAKAIPVILSGANAACCAETGSGKTVAYAAPLIQQLMKSKASGRNADRPPMSPLAIVLLPSKELVLQIGKVYTSIAEECGLSTCVLAPGMDFQRNLYRAQEQPQVDTIVSTAGSVQLLANQGVIKLSYVDHVIIDEADTLVDNSFIDTLGEIMKNIIIRETPDPAVLGGDSQGDPSCLMGSQLVLVGATVPRHLENSFGHLIDLESLSWVKTASLHQLPAHVTHVFHRLAKGKNLDELVKWVSREVRQNRPVMVFSNQLHVAVEASSYLLRHNIPNVCLHKGLRNKERLENLTAFQEGHVNVICCTDLASRGLDTLRVKTILNLEFPKHMSDYIHRAGRTGRLGASSGGQVINFITSKWNIELLQQIETAARRVTALPDVDANIKRKYEEYAAVKESRTVGGK